MSGSSMTLAYATMAFRDEAAAIVDDARISVHIDDIPGLTDGIATLLAGAYRRGVNDGRTERAAEYDESLRRTLQAHRDELARYRGVSGSSARLASALVGRLVAGEDPEAVAADYAVDGERMTVDRLETILALVRDARAARDRPDGARVAAWLRDPQRLPALTAFSAGPEREMARDVELMILRLRDRACDALRRMVKHGKPHLREEGEDVFITDVKNVIAAHWQGLIDRAKDADARLANASGMSTGLAAVILERAKQLRRWGNEHDDVQHEHGDLEQAAIGVLVMEDGARAVEPHTWIEWARRYADRSRRERLVIAAALLVAEVDRMDRAEAQAER